MTRWWSQYTSIPSPDALALLIGNFVKGSVGTNTFSKIINAFSLTNVNTLDKTLITIYIQFLRIN